MRNGASRIIHYTYECVVSRKILMVILSLPLLLTSSCQFPWIKPKLIDDPTYRLGEKAFLRGSYEEAVRNYGIYIAKAPSKQAACEAYCKRGRAYQLLGRLNLARQDFEKALKNPPDDEVEEYALMGLADCQRAAAEFEDAKRNYQRVLKKFPDFPRDEVLFKLARAYQGLAEWDKAFENFNRVLHEFPKSPYSQEARNYLESNERYFSIQTGSFRQRTSAENQRKELQLKRFNSHIVKQRHDGKTYYNVRVGRFSTWKDAKQEKLKLERAGYEARIEP